MHLVAELRIILNIDQKNQINQSYQYIEPIYFRKFIKNYISNFIIFYYLGQI